MITHEAEKGKTEEKSETAFGNPILCTTETHNDFMYSSRKIPPMTPETQELYHSRKANGYIKIPRGISVIKLHGVSIRI